MMSPCPARRSTSRVVRTSLAAAVAAVALPGLASAAPILQSASSSVTHNGTEVELATPLLGPRLVEGRDTGGAVTFKLRFDEAVSDVTATVVGGQGSVDGAPQVNGRDVTVRVTGVGVGKFATVSVTASDAAGNPSTSEATIGYLPGDANGDGRVDGRDVQPIRLYLGNNVADAETARADLDGNGRIDGRDVQPVRLHLGNRIENPAPVVRGLEPVDLAGGPATVSFVIDDYRDPVANLDVQAVSTSTSTLPNSAIALGGTGHERTLTITPPDGADGSAGVRVTVSDGSLSVTDSLAVTLQAGGDGLVTRDVWYGSFGSFDDVPWDQAPDERELIDELRVPNTSPNVDEFASRIRGFITAPVDGDYTFFVAGDDRIEFSLSNSDEPNDLWQRASVPQWTAPEQWNKYPDQQSRVLRLKGGEKYYFELRHLEYVSGDSVAVGWYEPTGSGVPAGGTISVIGADHLSTYRPATTAEGGTVFTTALRPVSNESLGGGNVVLVLDADENVARFRYAYSNLTGPIISQHLHAPDNTVLFDIDDADPDDTGWYTWELTAAGPYSKSQVRQFLKDGTVYLNLHTARFPGGEVTGTLAATAGSVDFETPADPPTVALGTSDREVHRLLTQATFGPDADSIARVKAIGQEAWVDEQLAKPWTGWEATYPSWEDPYYWYNYFYYYEPLYQRRWLTADDQLRQRVALALLEFFVVSRANAEILFNIPRADMVYMDVLGKGAFGNFRDLIEDVTLSPVMGRYLNMLNNVKADPSTGQVPNENYAREILQLFSTGLNRTHPDGTLMLSSEGTPIPVYDQEVVEGYSRICTGWRHDYGTANSLGSPSWKYVDLVPMAHNNNYHEPGTKLMLNRVVQPAGRGAVADLDAMHDELFDHPNTGPFLATHLIKRLVTSNPSPGYVYRVAKVFEDNGSGVRGDMKAVVRAVLMDYEARSLDAADKPGYGKVKEPMLAFINVYRAFGVEPNGYGHEGWGVIPRWGFSNYVGQEFFQAPTVFNYFAPDFSPRGPLGDAGLTAPEMQIINDSTSISYGNALRMAAVYDFGIRENFPNKNYSFDADVPMDLDDEAQLANNPAQLVDRVSLLLTGGTLDPELRQAVIDAVAARPAGNNAERRTRVGEAIWLVGLTPEARVQR